MQPDRTQGRFKQEQRENEPVAMAEWITAASMAAAAVAPSVIAINE